MAPPRLHAAARGGILLAGAILLADQAAKFALQQSIALWERVPVIPGLFNLVHYRNPGAAFGILDNPQLPWQSGLLIGITALAIGLILYMLATSSERDVWLCYGLGAILGGAAGNLVDRIRLGEVIDYLDFYLGSLHWPAFNLADAAISLGAVTVLLASFMRKG
jgi:signal peptidase II